LGSLAPIHGVDGLQRFIDRRKVKRHFCAAIRDLDARVDAEELVEAFADFAGSLSGLGLFRTRG